MSASRNRSSAGLAYDLLPPEPRRPSARPNRARVSEATDAEFTVIAPAERRPHRPRPPINDNIRHQAKPGPLARHVRHMFQRGEAVLSDLPDGIFSALTAMIFLAVFFLAGGIAALARMSDAPPQAGLVFTHVVTLPQEANGLRLLSVTGILENRTASDQAPGPLLADILLDGRMIGRTTLSLETGVIPAGKSRGFSAKLPHPGGKTPEVRLSLAAEAGRAL